MTAQEVRTFYELYLIENGYFPKVDEDGHVRFKVQGGTYLLVVDENDTGFFQLLFTCFCRVETAEGSLLAHAVANKITRDFKLVKVMLSKDNWVSTAVEQSFGEPDHFRAIFPRALQALRYGTQGFLNEMGPHT